jgi:hypothetical protein
MNKYKFIITYNNGDKDEVIVDAANRLMAFELYDELGYDNVIDISCYRIIEEDEK